MPKTPENRSVAGSEQLPGGPNAPSAGDQLFQRPRYRKTSSYSPEQADHDAYCQFFDRSGLTESESMRSPGPPSKSWGTGSYDERGRGLEAKGGKYGGGNSELGCGEHTTAPMPAKPRRPGRW